MGFIGAPPAKLRPDAPDRPAGRRPPQALPSPRVRDAAKDPHLDQYTATLGADPAEIGQVREAVYAMACRNGFSDRAADLVLALDEVLANAQEHGRAPVEIRAFADGRLVVEVTDVGDGFDSARVWQTHPPRHTGTRGRGLWIARQLADFVEIQVDPEGTMVRLEVSPDPHIGA